MNNAALLMKVCSDIISELTDLKKTKRLERKIGEMMAITSIMIEDGDLDIKNIEKSGSDRLNKLRNKDEG